MGPIFTDEVLKELLSQVENKALRAILRMKILIIERDFWEKIQTTACGTTTTEPVKQEADWEKQLRSTLDKAKKRSSGFIVKGSTLEQIAEAFDRFAKKNDED